MVREADSIGRVLAMEVEGERIEAGKPVDLLAGALVCGGSVEELMPRLVVTVARFASGVEVDAAG